MIVFITISIDIKSIDPEYCQWMQIQQSFDSTSKCDEGEDGGWGKKDTQFLIVDSLFLLFKKSTCLFSYLYSSEQVF